MTQYPTAEVIEAGRKAGASMGVKWLRPDQVETIYKAMRAKEQSHSPATPETGWQPIETAPKEYDRRLIGLLPDGRAVTIARHKSVSGWRDNGKGGHEPAGYRDTWSEEESSAWMPCRPTHWMPLEPPASDLGKAKP